MHSNHLCQVLLWYFLLLLNKEIRNKYIALVNLFSLGFRHYLLTKFTNLISKMGCFLSTPSDRFHGNCCLSVFVFEFPDLSKAFQTVKNPYCFHSGIHSGALCIVFWLFPPARGIQHLPNTFPSRLHTRNETNR